MIKGVIALASYNYYGGVLGDVLNRWYEFGVFTYALPFLLIFALVFGILISVKVFKENKSINAVIAVVVALMALQFDFVPIFFSELFPRLGVGLAVILVFLILLGLFAPDAPWVTYTFFGVGALIALIILVNTSDVVGWTQGYWWSNNWIEVIAIVGFIVLLILVVAASQPRKDVKSILTKAIDAFK